MCKICFEILYKKVSQIGLDIEDQHWHMSAKLELIKLFQAVYYKLDWT